MMLGVLTLDTDKRLLAGPRGEIVLSPLLFSVLNRLAARPGAYVTVSDAIAAAYPDCDDEPENAYGVVRNAIKHLRTTLEILGGQRVSIRGEPGVGWALIVRANG